MTSVDYEEHSNAGKDDSGELEYLNFCIVQLDVH